MLWHPGGEPTMTMENMTEHAVWVALDAHKGQRDLGGETYILHPLAVAQMCRYLGYSDAHVATAILHDVVEDTPYDLDDLRDYGFPEEVVEAVDAISRREGEIYREYIMRCASNKIARIVKIFDIAHNSRFDRMPEERHDELRGMVQGRYKRALNVLEREETVDTVTDIRDVAREFKHRG